MSTRHIHGLRPPSADSTRRQYGATGSVVAGSVLLVKEACDNGGWSTVDRGLTPCGVRAACEKEPVMNNTTFVGMDVHKNEHVVAVYTPGTEEPEVFSVSHRPAEIRKLAQRLLGLAPGPIVACYEAGVLGFSLKRQLEGWKIPCRVIAPSLIPVQPGQRVQTDYRDARKLGWYLRAGMLTEVQAPDEAQEGVRDLCRWRHSAQRDLIRVRHQVTKFLLRLGLVYRDGSHWTGKHHQWLRVQKVADPVGQEVYEAMLVELDHRQERVKGLDVRMEEVARQAPYREPVGWLCCLRGFKTVTALSIVSELYGIERFGTAGGLMSYLGLTPSVMSSGLSTVHGGITKAGNVRVRRLLVEASWHQMHSPVTSRVLAQRREGQPAWAVTVAKKAQMRLHRRYWSLVHKGKSPGKAVTAVARELVGFVWAMLRLKDPAAPGENAAAPRARKGRTSRGAAAVGTKKETAVVQ